MSAIEPLCRLIGVTPQELPKKEFVLIEAELFYHIYKELKEHFRMQHAKYFCLLRFTKEMEDAMLEENFIRLAIEDILLTKEYTAAGIASYINTHEDVVHEIILGRNPNPSAMLFRKIIELHRSVRSELYNAIMKKIAATYNILA